ncbi:major facilitator superfamily domain-containing protein [Mycena rebaudengoi]|nr:major facilitator superfamily domain-containing protein [Mycena rebaudengoi]
MNTVTTVPTPRDRGGLSEENEPLLVSSSPLTDEAELLPRRSGLSSQRRKFQASPYWVIPIVLAINIARGITMSPRIKVYNDIACRVLSEDCSSSAVQARASKIQATVITIMSILSSISTGPWSQYGDSKGRKFIFFLSVAGFISMETVFILVSGSVSAITRRGEAFILVGPVLEGMVGGLSVFNGVVHAYISDCTPDGSRSRIFSAIQGMTFVGLAIGPWISGIVLRFTDLGPYSLFYFSVALQLLLLVYIVLIFPESLKTKSSNMDVELTPTTTPTPRLKDYVKNFGVALMSPIMMFSPRTIDSGGASVMPPITMFSPRTIDSGGTSVRDYNLTLVGCAMFLYIVSTAIYPVKYLYGQHTYSWSPAELGFYMSLVSSSLFGCNFLLGTQLWTSRAINLLVLLPIVISYFKPKVSLVGSGTLSAHDIALELQFDRRLAQISLGVDGLADLLVAVSPSSSQLSFLAFSCLSSFTSGGNPALHSLGAVCLHALGHGAETGRLFGALAVLSAVSHSISPTIFAVTYSSTVSTHPKTIFYVATALLGTSVILLGRIRPKIRV